MTIPAADAHNIYFRPRLENGTLGGKYPIALADYEECRARPCLTHVVWFGWRNDREGTFRLA